MLLTEDLRKSVLQAAIQGTLVEQRSEEGTAESLYGLIKQAQPTLKANKNELNYDSMDFEIPETWKWVELNQLFDFVDYRGKTPHKISDGVFLITASNIKTGYMDYKRKEYISIDEYNTRKGRGITEKGDLLFTTEAPMGNAALCDLDECSCGQRVITFKEHKKDTALPRLYMYFILSPSFQNQLLNNCTGTTAKGIKADKLKHFRIPLPPLEEQRRIIKKLDVILAEIDRYGELEDKLTSLQDAFPDDFRKNILQAAIQGKITEQKEIENVDDIITKCKTDKDKAISDGKYKKEKFRGSIEKSEYPFDIPDNWAFIHISDMSLFQEGPGILAEDFRLSGVPLIRIAGMQGDTVSVEGCNYLDEEMVRQKWNHFRLDEGDIVISTSASMDKIAEVDNEAVGCIPYTGLIRFKMYGGINKEYFKYFIKSPFYMQQINEQKAGGMIKHYGPTHLKKMLFVLPPIEEQERIVNKLDSILPLVDELSEVV